MWFLSLCYTYCSIVHSVIPRGMIAKINSNISASINQSNILGLILKNYLVFSWFQYVICPCLQMFYSHRARQAMFNLRFLMQGWVKFFMCVWELLLLSYVTIIDCWLLGATISCVQCMRVTNFTLHSRLLSTILFDEGYEWQSCYCNIKKDMFIHCIFLVME